MRKPRSSAVGSEGSGEGSGEGLGSGEGEGSGEGSGLGEGSGSVRSGAVMAAVKVSLSQLTWAPSCSETKRRGTMVLSLPSYFTTPAGTPSGSCTLCPSTTAVAEPRVSTMVLPSRSSSTCRVSGTHTTSVPRASDTRRTGTRVRPLLSPGRYCTRAGASWASKAWPFRVRFTRSVSVRLPYSPVLSWKKYTETPPAGPAAWAGSRRESRTAHSRNRLKGLFIFRRASPKKSLPVYSTVFDTARQRKGENLVDINFGRGARHQSSLAF